MIGQIISQYEILDKLGEGGMGEVFLAYDSELQRKVALKFLPYTTDAEIKERFKREARATAALNHPNIVTVYEVAEFEERSYIALEYVEGASLMDFMARTDLSIDQAIDIAIQVCQGLSAAHHAGIIHRDVKPHNILVDANGFVKVTDFGLAKMRGKTRLTQEASTLGTLNYMSPEQVRGEDVDHRCDIFSFGVVLYELLTGVLPFNAEFEAGVVFSILTEKPAPLSAHKKEIPESMQEIIDRTLTKSLDSRYQSFDEILAQLTGQSNGGGQIWKIPPRTSMQSKKALTSVFSWGSSLLVGLLLTLGVYLLFFRNERAQEKIPIAVVDVVNETDERELDGLSGMLITALEQSRRLSVLTRSHMFDILKSLGKTDVEQIDEALGREICSKANINTIALAEVKKFGNVYTIDLKLVDSQKNEYIFTASEKDEGQESVPGMIDRLAEKTREALNETPVEIRFASRKVAEVTTPNLEAYQHYFKGQEYTNKMRLAEAQDEFKKAVELDPEFAVAHYGLAYAARWQAGSGLQTPDAQKQHLLTALEFIDSVPEKERFLIRSDWEITDKGPTPEGYAASIAILKEMEQIYPNDKEMLFGLGDFYYHSGDDSSAFIYFNKSLEIDPDFIRALSHLGWIFNDRKQYTEAETLFRRCLELTPGSSTLSTYLGHSLRWQRKYAEAEQLFQKALSLDPKNPDGFIGLGLVRLNLKKYAEAEKIFLDRLKLEPSHPAHLNILGQIYIETRNYEKAKFYYEKYINIETTSTRFKHWGKARLGQIALLQRNYQKAEEYLDEAMTLDSTQARSLRIFAYLHADQKRYPEALVYASKAADLNLSFENRNLLAWILVAGEIDIEAGIQFCREAMASKTRRWLENETEPDSTALTAIYPYLAIPEYTLGLANYKRREYAKAKQLFELALKLHPHRSEIEDDLEMVKASL